MTANMSQWQSPVRFRGSTGAEGGLSVSVTLLDPSRIRPICPITGFAVADPFKKEFAPHGLDLFRQVLELGVMELITKTFKK